MKAVTASFLVLVLLDLAVSSVAAQEPTDTEKRLAEIEKEYRGTYEREVGKAFEAQVADLDGKYLGALERSMQAAGKSREAG